MTTLPADAGSNAISSLLTTYKQDDFDQIRGRDLILPRAALMQAQTPLVMQGKCPAGSIADRTTGDVVVQPRGTGNSIIIPLMFWHEWIEWNKVRSVPKDQKVVERSVDPASKLAKRAEAWETYTDGQGREICAVTEYYNFIAIITQADKPDFDSQYMFGFSRSAHKLGKMWLNRLLKCKIEINGNYVRAPICANKWSIKTDVETKGENMFWVPVIGDANRCSLDELGRLLEISNNYKDRKQEIIERNHNREDDDAGAEAARPVNSEIG